MWPRLRDNICCCYVCHVLDSIARDLNLEQTTAERRQLVSLQKLLSRVFATLNSLPAPTRRTLGGYVLRFKKQADFDTLSKKVEPALTALKQGVDALCARETRADLEKRLKELPDADELSNKYGVPTTEAPRISEKMKQDIERRLQALKGGRPHKHGLDLFICRLNENYEMIPDRTTRRNRQFIVAVLSAFRLAHDPKTLDRALKKKKQFAGSMTVRPKSFSTGRFACTP
jgi:DNA repair ATPase RecN